MPRIYELGYGAIELKQSYQKNMLAGIGFSISISAIIALTLWIASITAEPPRIAPIERVVDTLTIIPLPGIVIIPDVSGIKAAPPDLSLDLTGIIEIVDNGFEAGTTRSNIPNEKEIEDIIRGIYGSGTGDEGDEGGFSGVVGSYDGIPSPDVFIPCQVEPIIVYEEPVIYPKLAAEGRFSATVIVQAFVSKEGRVLKAEAIKSTRTKMGFEEAAICSALKSVYRPAIQNGSPVGVWIVYKIKFVMD